MTHGGRGWWSTTLIYTGHSARHLGMIEAVKSVFGMRGTIAT